MIEELETHEAQMEKEISQKNKTPPTIHRMKTMMNEYYKNLKIEAKIED